MSGRRRELETGPMMPPGGLDPATVDRIAAWLDRRGAWMLIRFGPDLQHRHEGWIYDTAVKEKSSR